MPLFASVLEVRCQTVLLPLARARKSVREKNQTYMYTGVMFALDVTSTGSHRRKPQMELPVVCNVCCRQHLSKNLWNVCSPPKNQPQLLR